MIRINKNLAKWKILNLVLTERNKKITRRELILRMIDEKMFPVNSTAYYKAFTRLFNQRILKINEKGFINFDESMTFFSDDKYLFLIQKEERNSHEVLALKNRIARRKRISEKDESPLPDPLPDEKFKLQEKERLLFKNKKTDLALQLESKGFYRRAADAWIDAAWYASGDREKETMLKRSSNALKKTVRIRVAA